MRPTYVVILLGKIMKKNVLGIKYVIVGGGWVFDLIYEIFPLLWGFAFIGPVMVTVGYCLERI